MTIKVKLINIDDDVFQEAFDVAKVDSIMNEGAVKALEEIPEVMEIDCFKLPNDVVYELIANIVPAFTVSKWMTENDLKLTDDNGKPIKE